MAKSITFSDDSDAVILNFYLSPVVYANATQSSPSWTFIQPYLQLCGKQICLISNFYCP